MAVPSTGYRVAIVCSSENETRSHIISKLHLYRRDYNPLYKKEQYKTYLSNHLKTSRLFQHEEQVLASEVDKDQ